MYQLINRAYKKISIALTLSMLLTAVNTIAQKTQLDLEEVYELARQHYPANRQKELISKTAELNIQNLNTAFLPQVNLNAQASYQSQVTRISVPLPGFKIPSQTKDQYRATADVSQLLFDGGTVREQKNMQLLNSSVEKSSVEVELYALKNRINQLYFNILYQDELLKQTALLVKQIELGINKVKSQVENGTMLRSNMQVLQAQYLQTEQRTIETRNTRNGLLDALSLLIHQPLSENTILQVPSPIVPFADTVLNRPEITLYENQSRLVASQDKLTDAKNLPRASAFIQGGYGKPGLNLLSDHFDPYYIGGLRLTWQLGGLYTSARDKLLIKISRQRIALQKETFILNTRSALQQQKAEINRYMELVSSDLAIIELRSSISEAARAQLENAVISSNDYLREINAEDQARQAMAAHQLQLLQARINYQLSYGKL